MGQIVLSASVLLRDRATPSPALVVAISPVIDLSISNPAIDAVAWADPWLATTGLRYLANLWRGPLPIDDPLVSPLAADLTGQGPLAIFSSTRDITNPDTCLFVDKARAAGVDITYVEKAGLLNVYPVLPGRAGKNARRELIELILGSVEAKGQA